MPDLSAPSRQARSRVLEPTVWQATKDLGRAVKRSISFKRRQPKRTGPTAAEQVAAAERAAERAAAVEKAATKAAEKAEKIVEAAANEAEQKAGAEKAAAERAAAEKAAELARQKSLPGLPPRASDVRSAVGNLGAAIGRSGRRRSSVAFASDVKDADSLKPSPRQPSSIVGMVRRATKGVINEPDYLSVTNGGGDAELGLPPRASAVARAVDPLGRTETGDMQEAELPGPPPRASHVSRAVMHLLPRRSSGIPDLSSDVKAAVGGSRRKSKLKRRQVRRMGTRAADTMAPTAPADAESELVMHSPPLASDIAAAVCDL